jgi:hypothetical protein
LAADKVLLKAGEIGAQPVVLADAEGEMSLIGVEDVDVSRRSFHG